MRSCGIHLTDAVLPIFRSGGLTAFEIPLRCYLGEGYWLEKNEEKALQTLKEGIKQAEYCQANFFIGFTSRLMAQIYMEKDPGLAESLIKGSIDIFQDIKAEKELAMAYLAYGRLCVANTQRRIGPFMDAHQVMPVRNSCP